MLPCCCGRCGVVVIVIVVVVVVVVVAALIFEPVDESFNRWNMPATRLPERKTSREPRNVPKGCRNRWLKKKAK